jgi:hypothetical protein
MAGKDLDALAKGLADERISRGKALKRMGAALIGGLLASVPMTAAFAGHRTFKCGPIRCTHPDRCCKRRGDWACAHPNETCAEALAG